MRGTPSAVGTVLVNQSPANMAVLRVLIDRAEGQHEAATLYVNSATATIDFNSLPDKRIEFPFGDPGVQSTFQGYVLSVTPNRRFVGDTQITEQEISCLGASMVFKGNKPRFLTDLTATQMIASIVADSNLGFNDEFRNDGMIWRSLAQTNETDWEMILKLADRISARIVYERGVIRLINYLDISYRQLPSRSYTTKQDVSLNDRTDDTTGTVVEYTPISTSVRDPSYRTPTMAYLSAGQARVVHPQNQAGDTLVSSFVTDYPAGSQQEAEALQSGYYTPPWNQEGSLRVTGDAMLMPGSVIQVASSGKGITMQANYDGLWYVRGVEHSIGLGGRFFTTLDMGRATSRGYNWYAPRPFWFGDSRGVPLLRPVGSGVWVSNWRQTL